MRTPKHVASDVVDPRWERVHAPRELFAIWRLTLRAHSGRRRRPADPPLAELLVTRHVPSPDVILAGLSDIANQWRSIAVFWHAYVAVLLLWIVVRACRSVRLLGCLLVLPIASVSVAAWASHNPFNGAMFAGLSVVLASIAYNLPEQPIQMASRRSVLVGSIFVAFGWIYPHFVDTSHWSEYLIAAPLGLLPCPTLSAIIGVTLVVSGLSVAWSRTLATAGLLYSAIGVIRLAVSIDLVLFAGAATLIATVAHRAAKTPASLRIMNGRRV